MTFYTSGLKTHLLDPVQHSSNFRTEFRLHPNTVYLSNFRLANVGVSNTSTNESFYNSLVGTHGVIRSIHLYDGNQLLDQILEANIWSAFTAYNRSNKDNNNQQTWLNRNAQGYAYKGADVPNNGNQTHTDANASIQLRHTGRAKARNDAQGIVTQGYLSLKGLLPMLDASNYVPSTVFKDLRLVIKYDGPSSSKAVFKDDDTGIQITKATGTAEPLLIVDEIVSPERQSQITSGYKGVNFLAIEHDRAVVPAFDTPDGNFQSTTLLINGFDNKTIRRLLIVNTQTNTNSIMRCVDFKGLGSAAQHQQKIQLRVNGQNIYSGSGVTRPMERLARLTDTWGTCNSFPGTANTYLQQVEIPGQQAANDVVDTTLIKRFGQLDYFGAGINDRILELQIDYSRLPINGKLNDTSLNPGQQNGGHTYKQQLFLNLFAEAQKRISVQGGGYSVLYV